MYLKEDAVDSCGYTGGSKWSDEFWIPAAYSGCAAGELKAVRDIVNHRVSERLQLRE
jgi:hypothetical protein